MYSEKQALMPFINVLKHRINLGRTLVIVLKNRGPVSILFHYDHISWLLAGGVVLCILHFLSAHLRCSFFYTWPSLHTSCIDPTLFDVCDQSHVMTA